MSEPQAHQAALLPQLPFMSLGPFGAFGQVPFGPLALASLASIGSKMQMPFTMTMTPPSTVNAVPSEVARVDPNEVKIVETADSTPVTVTTKVDAEVQTSEPWPAPYPPDPQVTGLLCKLFQPNVGYVGYHIVPENLSKEIGEPSYISILDVMDIHQAFSNIMGKQAEAEDGKKLKMETEMDKKDYFDFHSDKGCDWNWNWNHYGLGYGDWDWSHYNWSHKGYGYGYNHGWSDTNYDRKWSRSNDDSEGEWSQPHDSCQKRARRGPVPPPSAEYSEVEVDQELESEVIHPPTKKTRLSESKVPQPPKSPPPKRVWQQQQIEF